MDKSKTVYKKETEELKANRIEISSVIEITITKLAIDIIDDVRKDLAESVDITGLGCGLETIAYIKDAVVENDLETLVEIERVYRNNDIYSVHELLIRDTLMTK